MYGHFKTELLLHRKCVLIYILWFYLLGFYWNEIMMHRLLDGDIQDVYVKEE
jgi:hypothetical protein